MGTEVDVFISNYTIVDPEIYQLWIEGHSASEAVSILNQRGLGQSTGVPIELIASDVLDHYRTYNLLEKLLINPNKLQEQFPFQIEPQTRQLLIEKYYDFDDVVVRELIGKKLTSKQRKDLDEVADKTGIPLKSCRRQFDNVKRISKIVEDMSGSVVQNIQNSFYLPEGIAKKYACVIFLAYVRFETSKRKLAHVSFARWKRCSEAIMDHWTNKLVGNDNYEIELDKDFLIELKEAKVFIDKEREHKYLVCGALNATIKQKGSFDVEQNFRLHTRPIINLATSIHRPRDMRNLFVDLSNLVDLYKQDGWTAQETETFLNTYTSTGLELEGVKDSASLKNNWEKYMKVLTECILAIS